MNRPLLWMLGLLCTVIIICNVSGMAENRNPIKNLTGDNKKITGTVDSIPESSHEKIMFVFRLDTINDMSVSNHSLCHTKVQVTCSGKPKFDLSAGDVLSLYGSLSMAESLRNPGGFNYALYLRGKNIDGLFYIENTDHLSFITKSHQIKYTILSIRTKLSEICDQFFTEEQSDVIKGMLFGDKAISDDLQEQFSDAGISHLLAVSGLHVGYICLIITWITSLLKLSPRIKLLILIPCLVYYCILTGCSASVIRAAVMTAIPVLGDISHRHYDALNGLCLAAILILCIWPAQLFSAGFQLSFGAVAAIILFYRPILFSIDKKWHLSGKFYDSLCLTFCATIGTLPAVLYHYHTLNLVSLISNLVMVPLGGLLMTCILTFLPLMMLMPGMAGLFAFFPGTLSQLLIDFSSFFAALPGLQFNGPFPGFLNCLILFIVIFALCGYFNLRHLRHKQILSVTIFGMIAIIIAVTMWPKPLTVTFLDVGQGDCTLIETPKGGVYLIDGGGYEGYRAKEKSLENPISEKVLLPALYSKGITRLDGVFITHNHSDHAQGIEELLTKLPVDRIYLSTKYNGYALLYQKVIPVTRLYAGTKLTTQDGCSIEILWPDANIEMLPDDEQNNASLVFRLRYGNRSFLFTGDVGIETEENLNNVSADVIKIGHHGSSGSTGPSFLSKVSPDIAVISVGRYNTYGHPSESVLQAIASQKSLCYRTDRNGAIVIQTNGHNIKIRTYVNSVTFQE